MSLFSFSLSSYSQKKSAERYKYLSVSDSKMRSIHISQQKPLRTNMTVAPGGVYIGNRGDPQTEMKNFKQNYQSQNRKQSSRLVPVQNFPKGYNQFSSDTPLLIDNQHSQGTSGSSKVCF